MSREIKIVLASLLFGLGLGICFQAGYWVGSTSNSISVDDPYLAIIQEAWDIIAKDYVDRDNVDYALLSQYAIQGMIEALDDPYTVYMDPETLQIDEDDTAGSYGGIGVRVAVVEGQLVVISVFNESPAAEAGMQIGDVILAIDGDTTERMTLAEAIVKVRGDKGTPVILLILHTGETEPANITIERAEIKVSSVKYQM
ncbi:MAG: PDZ domain-containing protein, partial [Dehalococcoidales bacterium]|nr:PDZ domain-containing protein [Dehalococcoidales bacterium]